MGRFMAMVLTKHRTLCRGFTKPYSCVKNVERKPEI